MRASVDAAGAQAPGPVRALDDSSRFIRVQALLVTLIGNSIFVYEIRY
jgi:hypothetical protein